MKCSASSSGSSFTFLPAHVYARPASVVCCDTLQAYTPKHAVSNTQVLKEGLSPSKSNPLKLWLRPCLLRRHRVQSITVYHW